MRFGENSGASQRNTGREGKGREGKWVVFIGGNILGFLGGCHLCTSVKPVGFWNGTKCKIHKVWNMNVVGWWYNLTWYSITNHTLSICYKSRHLVGTCHQNLMIILCFDPRVFFLKTILWCSQCDNHPENNLAKFGCILDMNFL
jgi:hypothetical protein